MTEPHFNGADYVPPRDDPRLSSQYKRIWAAMLDSKPRTLEEIAELTGDPPASVSAQLRHMRKPRFGAHTIEREHRGGGLYSYRLIVNLNPPVVPFDVPQSMTDLKAKGAADFAANTKDEVLFHNSANPGRLYREGWHAARRAAEGAEALRLAGFQHGGGPNPEAPSSYTERLGPGICDACGKHKPALTAIYCAPVAGACICDDCREPKPPADVPTLPDRAETLGSPPTKPAARPESSPEVKAPTRGKTKAGQMDLFG